MSQKPTYEELEQRVKELREVVVGQKRDKKALRQSQRELRIRNRIANIFLVVPDDEMYGEVLQVVLEAMKSEYGAFGYIDENKAIVFPSLTRDVWDKCRVSDKEIVFPREVWRGGFWGQSIIGKKTCCSNKPFRVPEGHVPILKMLTVPVVYQGEVIGQMAVANKPTDYDENDKELLESIVDHISPILRARFQRDKQKRGRKRAEEEKKKLEAQLLQAQKIQAIGTLAGGIAHDFNNILYALMVYADLALDDAPEGSLLRSNLQEVIKAGDRAKNLVEQILTFSRQTEHELRPVQIKLIARESLKLLRASLPTTIEMRQNIQSDSMALADPIRVHRVLMNLCTNAAHAMREEGGTLEVSLADVEFGSDFAARHPDITPGPHLRLTVSDTGHGMTFDVGERIFDPFFTTKGPDEGAGMGLSVVHGIVKGLGGTITVYSEVGKGSTFQVYLPLVEDELKPETETGKPPTSGDEHILFIDDEQVLANMGKQMLERLGYEVVSRPSSIEALELFRAQPDRFDLVITDMTMPGMTGKKLAEELMKIRPDIPIILCTGYSKDISEEQAKEMGIKAFAMKPLARRDLADTIRKVLDE